MSLSQTSHSNHGSIHGNRRRYIKRFRQVCVVLVLLLVGANTAAFVVYHGRTYPRTTVADRPFGSRPLNTLTDSLKQKAPLPATVDVSDGTRKVRMNVASLGLRPDYAAVQAAAGRHSTLPLLDVFRPHALPLYVTLGSASGQTDQQATLERQLSERLSGFTRPAANAAIIRTGDGFRLDPDSPARRLNAAATARRIIDSVERGRASVTAAFDTSAAAITAASLQPKLTDLQRQTETPLTVRYGSASKRYSPGEIASWFVPSGSGSDMSLSEPAVRAAVSSTGAGFGISVQDLSSVSRQAVGAVQSHKPMDYTFVTPPPARRTVTYCTAVRGVGANELPGLASKLQQTYTDSRGWSLGGLISFRHADTGCDLTVWLAAPDQMASFGEICDAEWSCTVSPNVIINYDRWQGTTASWQRSGGSLENYRAMAINHETGHWFGFGHSGCPGAGQPAPVMEQQSIDLQGCVFNPWPTAIEQTALQQRLGW